MSGPDLRITLVGPAQWRRLRAVRLAALAESPGMFGSTLSREQAFDEAEWRRRAQRPVTFLASRGGCDVGLAGVHEFAGIWTVVGMWIAPEDRGTGVVDALVQACEDAVTRAGSDTIALGVMEDNAAGLSAYRRLGFTLTRRRDHVRDGRHEAWLAKTLPRPREHPSGADRRRGGGV